MKTRIISGLAICPLLFIVWLGGYYLLSLSLIVFIFSIYEFLKAYFNSNNKNKIMLLYLVIILLGISAIAFIDSSNFYLKHIVFLVFIIAFFTDIFAYFIGVFLGKHKLAPKISPKKTIEGLVGGVFFAGLGTFLFFYLFYHFDFVKSLDYGFFIGVLGGLISQAGDLTASLLKRKLGIKDFSNLIPGHGGILDRIDGVLFVAIYLAITLFISK
ncbi:MAG: phosphatidate cytidylyltransferase [Clostridiales Family XIII bacterium]|jgi:phosphatidate cytidylyltransferase|nr:phosphatidate cytidylyltransferase [Clostridiales Family XIII bacterium]